MKTRRAIWVVGALLAAAPGSRAPGILQDWELDYERMADTGQAVFDRVAPASVKANYEVLTADEMAGLFTTLQAALSGESLDSLAANAPQVRQTLARLRADPKTQDYADQAGEHGHGVGVAAESAQKELHLLVHHGVLGHAIGEGLFLFGVGQLPVEDEVAGLHVIALHRDLVDGIAAVEQLALVAVDIGDGRAARGGGQKARVIGEFAGLAVELADVDHVRADGAFVNRQVDARCSVAERERGFIA